MMAPWRQFGRKWEWRRIGPLAIALIFALIFVYVGTWTPAHGQESPVATPGPAAPAPTVAASPVISVQLPSLSGTVHDGNGTPLAGMIVTAYQLQQGTWLDKRDVTSNSAGEFRFPWMPAGNYRLYFSDPEHVHASTYYPNAGDIEEASDIVVTGAQVVGLDTALAAGGQITGTLSWPDGPAPYDSTIQLFYVTSAPITTRLNSHDDLNLAPELLSYRLVDSKNFTDAVVSYTFPGLLAGKYRVCAQASALHSFQTECFDNTVFGRHATDVVVADGATVPNVEIKLGDETDTATLTGIITSLVDQKPAAGLLVQAVDPSRVDFFYTSKPYQATTDPSGIFRIKQLPVGNYTLHLSDSSGHYLNGDYHSPTEPGVTTVAISNSTDITITAAITPAGIITGLTTVDGVNAGLSGKVQALVKGSQGWFPGGIGDIVAATGAYTITGLVSGTYHVQYLVDLGPEIYYGAPGSSLDTASDVAVMTGTTVGNINVDLTPYIAGQPYGSISGQVSRDNAPQANLKISIFDASADCCVAPVPFVTTLTDGEGHFTVTGLPPGQYRVGVSAPDQPTPTLYAVGQPSYEFATKYLIGNPADGLSSQTIGDVNFTLGATGSISRTVIRPDNRPVAGVSVSIYQNVGDPGSWPLVASAQTDATGHYAFTDLMPGKYQVCIAAAGLTESSCGGHNGKGKGLDAVVTAGQQATGPDIVDVP